MLSNPGAAFVIDDIASQYSWRVRGIEIRGSARVLESGGEKLGPGFDPEMFRITPGKIVSWGFDDRHAHCSVCVGKPVVESHDS